MKRILPAIIAAILLLGGCTPEKMPLDAPYVYIRDSEGGDHMSVDADANNYSVTLYVCTSSRKMDHDVTVSFRAVAGNGLAEGSDFRIKQGMSGDLTFAPGIYQMPIHIIWNRAASFDPAADNTLTFELVGCSESDFTIGLLSLTDTHLCTTYKFTRVKSE